MSRLERLDIRLCLLVMAILVALRIGTRDEGILFVACLVMIWSIFALGYDLAFGTTGILSFGHAAFFGMGAFGMTWAQLHGGLPFSAGAICAGLLGAACAWVVSLIGSRITGLFFSLLTLMLAELMSVLMLTRLRRLSGGVDGLPGVARPAWGTVDFFANANFFWVVLAIFCAVVLCCWVLRRSPLGQALQAVRQNPVRAEQLGFAVRPLRQAAMAISGGLSGVAGGLLASLMMYTGPQMLNWKVSGDVLIMTLLGGSGTLLGPIVGVAFFEVLREVLAAYSDYWYGLVGLVFILCTLFLPRGIAGTVLHAWSRR
ncbi:MAG: branched-chain amino acid ABC transporter permease [Comamonadaceae bacterium]|nr:MAG: branched-chain amino acid ABC transporter permease [Comamonadaceae bacterium]